MDDCDVNLGQKKNDAKFQVSRVSQVFPLWDAYVQIYRGKKEKKWFKVQQGGSCFNAFNKEKNILWDFFFSVYIYLYLSRNAEKCFHYKKKKLL